MSNSVVEERVPTTFEKCLEEQQAVFDLIAASLMAKKEYDCTQAALRVLSAIEHLQYEITQNGFDAELFP
jgi:hypothetical protein